MRHHVAGHLIQPSSARLTVIEPSPVVPVAEVPSGCCSCTSHASAELQVNAVIEGEERVLKLI